MKRVLIITYYWPPYSGPGVQRWLKFAKYLPSNGWFPVVYTAKNPDIGITDESLLEDIPEEIETIKTSISDPSRILHLFNRSDKVNDGHSRMENPSLMFRLGRWFKGNVFIPDSRIVWKRKSVRVLSEYLNKKPVDVIVSTGPPHSLHLIAEKLSKRTNIPWIMDIRDPMTQLISYKNSNPSRFALKRYKRIERRLLSNADLITATSPGLKKSLLGLPEEKFRCITNGFDEDDIVTGIKPDPEKIVMSYAGQMSKHRIPALLWNALEQRLQQEDDFRRRFQLIIAGTISPESQRAVMDLPQLSQVARFIGHISHREVLELHAKSNVTLLLNFKNQEDATGIIPGKLFELIASGRPILSIGPNTSDYLPMMQSYKYFTHFEHSAESQINSYVNDLTSETPENTNNNELSKFSRYSLTKEYALIMDSKIIN